MSARGSKPPDPDSEHPSLPFAQQQVQLEVLSAADLVFSNRVEVPNRSGAQFMVHGRTGRQFVVKRRLSDEDLRGESIGWTLSRALSIKTPMAAVVREGTQLGWASELVEGASAWRAADATQCNPDDVAAVFMIDAIVGNIDRHSDNVLVTDSGEGRPLEVISIDLANSWLGGGAPEGLLVQRVSEVPDDAQFLRGVDAETIRASARDTLDRAEDLAKHLDRIAGLVYSANLATRLDGPAQQEELAKALQTRLAHASELLSLLLRATIERIFP